MIFGWLPDHTSMVIQLTCSSHPETYLVSVYSIPVPSRHTKKGQSHPSTLDTAGASGKASEDPKALSHDTLRLPKVQLTVTVTGPLASP